MPWSKVVVSNNGQQIDIALEAASMRYRGRDELRPATLEDLRALLVTPCGSQIKFIGAQRHSPEVFTVAGAYGFSGIDTVWIAHGERWFPRLVLTPEGATCYDYDGSHPGSVQDVINFFSAQVCPSFVMIRSAPQPETPERLTSRFSAAAK